MIIKEYNYCGIVASTTEHTYNAWMRGNTINFYALRNDKITDVVFHFLVHIRNGKIKLVIDGVSFTLFSHDELVSTIRCAFPDDCHDIITIIETLLYNVSIIE